MFVCFLTQNRLQGAKKVSPFFVPSLLINVAAGHVSMKFGLRVSLYFISNS